MPDRQCDSDQLHPEHNYWLPGEGWPEDETAEPVLYHCLGLEEVPDEVDDVSS